MPKRLLYAALVAASALVCPASAPAATYHGFQIDDSARQLTPDALASLQAQLDVVDAVGLPPQVVAALKQTPIVVDPGLRGNPGIFSMRGGGAVYVQPIVFASNKPILLHELLHAYHVKVLGKDRSEIRQAYQHAKQGDAFPARYRAAHFLENDTEFFAVTGTLYLFGDIQQPPFSCAALAKLDADYQAFLATLFGPHTCAPQPGA